MQPAARSPQPAARSPQPAARRVHRGSSNDSALELNPSANFARNANVADAAGVDDVRWPEVVRRLETENGLPGTGRLDERRIRR
jgi:hypothetical protein